MLLMRQLFRLYYGGIHYRMAIEYGVEQGEKVGNYISQNLTTLSNSQEVAQN